MITGLLPRDDSMPIVSNLAKFLDPSAWRATVTVKAEVLGTESPLTSWKRSGQITWAKNWLVLRTMNVIIRIQRIGCNGFISYAVSYAVGFLPLSRPVGYAGPPG